ncbi:MAG TPA: DinB family protein [Pyrinomonadaceae bacterium]|jgi:uncharacterized damage-inducible protein DinB
MEIKTVASFLDYFEKIRGRTMRVARCIPPDKLEWTYKAGKFTLGDLLRHLAAAERFMFAENVQCKPSRYPGHGTELADGYAEVFEYVERMHGESMEIFSRLGDDHLQLKCTNPGGQPITVWKWLRAMTEHEIHHRGQIYLYLAMLDIHTPPLYGLTSEEVLERSR